MRGAGLGGNVLGPAQAASRGRVLLVSGRSVPFASAQDAACAARFFSNRPQGAATWSKVVAAVASPGLQQVATQSRVAILGRTRFMWCPQARLDGSVYVRFLLPHPVDDARVRCDAMGGRWSLRILVPPDGPDGDMVAWLLEARDLDAGDGPLGGATAKGRAKPARWAQAGAGPAGERRRRAPAPK